MEMRWKNEDGAAFTEERLLEINDTMNSDGELRSLLNSYGGITIAPTGDKEDALVEFHAEDGSTVLKIVRMFNLIDTEQLRRLLLDAGLEPIAAKWVAPWD